MIAFWDWKSGARAPDARMVVMIRDDETMARFSPDVCINVQAALAVPGRTFVVASPAEDVARGILPSPGGVPALFAQTKADLEQLKRLAEVRSTFKALVLSPTEPIDFGIDLESTQPLGLLACGWCRGAGYYLRSLYPTVDGNENTATCKGCDGSSLAVDLIAVIPRPDGKPLHPDHVRRIRDQAALVKLPFVFLGWGEWLPITAPREAFQGERVTMSEEGLVLPASWADALLASGSCWAFEKVGAEVAGRLLDGVEHLELPEWVE